MADFFIITQNPDIPSLQQVEKNLKNYQYNSIYQFASDVRNIWSYYYTNYGNNVDIYNRTCNINKAFEEIFKELEQQSEEKNQYHELSRQVEKLTKEMNQVKGSGTLPTTTIRKAADKPSYQMDKPMTIQEKNNLGNSIRMLSPDQLKGIINILSDTFDIESSSKYFEFDIEALPNRKLRELEKYVKNCLKNKQSGPGANQARVVERAVPPKSTSFTDTEQIDKLKVKKLKFNVF